jgi:LysM repeat protein
MKKAGQKTAGMNLRSMNNKWFYLVAVLFLFVTTGWTAPQSYSQPYQAARPSPAPGDDLTSVLRQLRAGIADLKHEIRNHESEIRTFENKLQNQEAAFDQLRQQLIDDVQSQRDFVRASNINLEGKTETLDQAIQNLEMLVRNMMADLRQMKTQANDSVAVLGQYKQKISELENLLHTQSQHMQNLEAALQSMMEVWQAKEAAREIALKANEAVKTYKVQPGDSLEKIARAQKVSVQALRDANQLTNDRIIVGQTLKIP